MNTATFALIVPIIMRMSMNAYRLTVSIAQSYVLTITPQQMNAYPNARSVNIKATLNSADMILLRHG